MASIGTAWDILYIICHDQVLSKYKVLYQKKRFWENKKTDIIHD
jgi:hypothetical protein